MNFKLFLSYIDEGRVKQHLLDPYTGAVPYSPKKETPKLSSLDKRWIILSAQAGVPIEKVKELWAYYDANTDSTLDARYAIITNSVKKALGLNIGISGKSAK